MAQIFGNPSTENSEVKILNYLKQFLNDEWRVYQNFLLDKNVDDGQIDFLILHQTIGGIVLEVKGGKIETYFNPDNQYDWVSIDRNHIRYSIKDPYIQSKNQSWTLKKYLRDIKTMMHNFNFVNAVAFPDIEKLDFESPYINELNTFTRNSFNTNLSFQFKKLLQNVQVRPHSETTLNQLHNYLLPIFKSNTTLQSSFDFMDSKFNEATDEQFKAMIELEDNSKLYVKGPAGTGKTLIAINFAKRMLESGKTVLLVCHTQNLGDYLKKTFSEYKKIYVGNIHALLREVNNLVTSHSAFGLEKQKEKDYNLYTRELSNWKAENNNESFDFEVQNLYRLFEILDIKLDAVLIDECQDFSLETQEALSLTNLYSGDPKFYIFGDPNQSQQLDWKPLFTEPTRKLTKNMRNSNEINEFINKLFNLEVENSGISDNLNVELELLESDDLTLQLEEIKLKLPKVLHKLTSEGVKLSQIAILGLHVGHAKEIQNLEALGKKIYEIEDLTVDSSLRFKGLEKDVIVAIFPDYKVANVNLLKSQIYTGISRPQKKLIILLGNKNKKILANLK